MSVDEETVTTERITLTGEIVLTPPGGPAMTATIVEFRADGSLQAPTQMVARIEGRLDQLVTLSERLPRLARLFEDYADLAPDTHVVVELYAGPALLRALRAAGLPEDISADIERVLGHEAWCAAAFDFGRYEPLSVGVRVA